MNARPTRQEPLACHAMSNASRSRLRLSSSLSASCRLLAAAPAPGPSWDNLFSRQRAFARTMVTLIARRISPVTLPSCPGPASHPWALLMAATLDSAKANRSLWKSGEMSPQGPATNLPSLRPPKSRNLLTRGPGGFPALPASCRAP